MVRDNSLGSRGTLGLTAGCWKHPVPPSTRVSPLMAKGTLGADIVKAVEQGSPAEPEDVQFVDIFRGKGVPAVLERPFFL
jgi:hypothetical protein